MSSFLPLWTNSAGQSLSSITFLFSGFAKQTSALNVDSASVTVKLKLNAINYPASVALSRPQNCTIGIQPVPDSEISILFNGVAIASNSILTFANNLGQQLALRFSASANVATYSGNVACISSGLLRYSF